MKRFLAIYTGSDDAFESSGWNALDASGQEARSKQGMAAWTHWVAAHQASIFDIGTPLGKTKIASPEGISDIRNAMVGYVIVQAKTHDAAAKLFENHPHFSVFPGEAVEIMECLPLPGQ